ncbi:MAG: hypothetical protein HYU66_23305 [Armatimonadetes bacterium]|nr:hypothetical protein [Armatimonadota bacterium]
MKTDKDKVPLVSALTVLLLAATVPAWSLTEWPANGQSAPREQYGQATQYLQFLTDCSVNWTKNFANAEVPVIRHLQEIGNWDGARRQVEHGRAMLDLHRRLMEAKLTNYNLQNGGGTIEMASPGGGTEFRDLIHEEHVPRISRACDDAAATLSSTLF